ncbi:B-cell CLL/lymphoma 6 member B protein isoform X1 [Diceros bicornis minor]|uniref:B-cell CLL/lymphoma 6 member B protein isoform X1 n=1 Tax=Diceros bicornis minor TaxID=77932 RepID=UPI0026EC87EE|nr:B-cell CLL/lymphoma 6 member B protein isoform X1 [Diceros bicornis minor]
MGSTATAEGALGYVREFTRHSSDVLGNLNELRLRGILTDVTLLVGGQPLRAHKAILIACSGFFYSIFRGRAGVGVDVLSLPGGPEAGGFAPLLDFMYTSRLRLSPATAPAVLAAATYLQMEHVVQACHRFIQASYEPLGISLRPVEAEPPTPPTVPPPGSPRRSEGHPDPPTESRSCSQGPPSPGSPDPKACNWKKYKFIVLNSQASQAGSLAGERNSGQLCPQARLPSGDEASSSSSSSSEEGPIPGPQSRLSPTAATVQFKCGAPINTSHLLIPLAQETTGSPSGQARPLPRSEFFSCQNCEAVAGCSSGLDPLAPGDQDKPYKCHLCRSAFRYKGNLASHRTVHTGEKPYHCSICGARFNRPANLKTHSRIHSGEKPYKCETCGSRFVQVAHLRAHVLIHTGEKPYPCPTCGTRFRHLQTLKSHVRIHTGEKPYHMARRSEPPDGGWGWMVVLSAFFQSALVFGVLRSFGVFFVEFVAAFEEQAARVSWIASIGIAVQQFGSPVGSALSTKFGPRPVVMAGGILAALGMLLASFATSLIHLYLSIGLLSGRVASGWLGDAVPGPVTRLLTLWTTLTGVSLALFPIAQAPTALVALAVAYGFTSGALTPVAFSVLPELVGTGRIYCGLGLLQMVESIGGLLGAPLSGYLRDVTGNYTASFVVAGAFLLAGSGVLITLPHFCFSAPTLKPQELVTEALDTKVPLPKEGLGED